MVDISIFRLVRVVSCLPCHQKGEAVIGMRHGKKAVLGFTYLALLRILHTRIEGDMKRTAILELAQHQLTQKPVLRCEVGVGARCALYHFMDAESPGLAGPRNSNAGQRA